MSEKRKEMKKYRMRGLNPRPIACEAIVITTTPTRPVSSLSLPHKSHQLTQSSK